jgi:hypothetical protein
MNNNKKKKTNTINLNPTLEELALEEQRYKACKKPIKITCVIYAFAATLYLCNQLATGAAISKLPEREPIESTLQEYQSSHEYINFKTELQNEAYNKLINGEITTDEYNFALKIIHDDQKFEDFLRTIEDDPEVQQALAEYDDYNNTIRNINKTYSALAITSLSSLLVSTIILAKYRFREMDIEEARKKREEAKSLEKPIIM